MRDVLCGRSTRRVGVLVGGAVLVAAWGSPLGASPRATPVELPTGERYYLFAVGGSFPDGHRLEIWKETNGLRSCSIPEAPPVGHATEASGQSGLQVTPVRCDGVAYAADSRIYPTPDEQPPPSPMPTLPPDEQPTPTAGPTPVTTPPPAPPITVAVPPSVEGGETQLAPLVIEVGGQDPVAARPSKARGWGILTGLFGGLLFVVGRRLERLRPGGSR